MEEIKIEILESGRAREVWKPIIGFEGVYEVSNFGIVRSLKRTIKSVSARGLLYNYIKKGIIMKLSLHKQYLYCSLFIVQSKQFRLSVHKAVAQAFIPNPENKSCVNHIDGNKLNNTVENLEWVTIRENTCHSHSKTNKYVGVTLHKKTGKWQSRIWHNDKAVHIGLYTSQEEAYSARVKYEIDNNIKNKYLSTPQE